MYHQCLNVFYNHFNLILFSYMLHICYVNVMWTGLIFLFLFDSFSTCVFYEWDLSFVCKEYPDPCFRYLLHLCKQASSVSKLFSLPRQPPYTNCWHRFVALLYHHLTVYSEQGPTSWGSLQMAAFKEKSRRLSKLKLSCFKFMWLLFLFSENKIKSQSVFQSLKQKNWTGKQTQTQRNKG